MEVSIKMGFTIKSQAKITIIVGSKSKKTHADKNSPLHSELVVLVLFPLTCYNLFQQPEMIENKKRFICSHLS